MTVSGVPPSTGAVRWYVMDEEEETFGPASTEEVERWIAEGSVTRECQVMREGSEVWQWAGDIFAIPTTPYAAEMPVAEQTGGGFDIFGGGVSSYSGGSSRSSRSDDDRPKRGRKRSNSDVMMYILIGGAVISVIALVFLLAQMNG